MSLFLRASGRRILTCLKRICMLFVRAAMLVAFVTAVAVMVLLSLGCMLFFVLAVLELIDWLFAGGMVIPGLFAGTPLEPHLREFGYIGLAFGLGTLLAVMRHVIRLWGEYPAPARLLHPTHQHQTAHGAAAARPTLPYENKI